MQAYFVAVTERIEPFEIAIVQSFLVKQPADDIEFGTQLFSIVDSEVSPLFRRQLAEEQEPFVSTSIGYGTIEPRINPELSV